jgi:hypothetical protein
LTVKMKWLVQERASSRRRTGQRGEGRELGVVEQLAPGGRPLQLTATLDMLVSAGSSVTLIWNVIVVEPDPPAIIVTVLGEAVSVIVTGTGTALTGFTAIMNSNNKPTANSVTLFLLKDVTKRSSPVTDLTFCIGPICAHHCIQTSLFCPNCRNRVVQSTESTHSKDSIKTNTNF